MKKSSAIDLNPKSTETDHLWVQRIQAIISKKIKSQRDSGTSINRIILLMPPKFLERIYAVTFACNTNEARLIIREEAARNGSIALFGSIVVSNENILYPEIQMLGDLRQSQKAARRIKIKHLGSGRNKK